MTFINTRVFSISVVWRSPDLVPGSRLWRLCGEYDTSSRRGISRRGLWISLFPSRESKWSCREKRSSRKNRSGMRVDCLSCHIPSTGNYLTLKHNISKAMSSLRTLEKRSFLNLIEFKNFLS